ncbi:DUF3248 domain-containing protein [Deinococcus sp. YIM 134068]|uniref:DUF3248 domain-containing protein n=1 Tax=Deinococcus lichenicola TaxID=3118910 RepID=UPI002F9465D0
MTDPTRPDPPGSDEAQPQAEGAAQLARHLESLGAQLVWRVGKDELSDDVVVRLGFASATPRFAHLPRLRSVADTELQAAVQENRVVIEWVD